MSAPSAVATGAMPAARARCPYLGLIPYSEADARFFFGREEDTRLIVASLYSTRVTTLFGPSGVGKSSVLRAGVIRELRGRIERAKARGARPSLLVVYFNAWQGDVRSELRRTIASELAAVAGEDAARGLPEGTLSEVLEAISDRHRLDVMLLLDQFEEYFRYETRFGEPGSFAVEFAEAAQRKSLPINFLLSLREDSLAELDRFKLMVGNLLSNWYRLERLSLEAARNAVLGPVDEYNRLPDAEREFAGRIEVEAALAEAVVQQVQMGRVVVGEAGKSRSVAAASGVETPYLQLVMVKLWETEMARGSRVLRRSTLEELRGAAEIVRSHVDAVMKGLTSDEQRLAENAFDYLVTDSGTKIAWRARDLAGKLGDDSRVVKAWLEKLSSGSARILTPVAPCLEFPDEPQYEIFHDTLSKAVLSWRRRRVDARRSRRRLVRVSVISAALVLGGLAFALYQSRVAEYQQKVAQERTMSARAQAEAAASTQRALQAEMQQRLLAEALAAEKSGNEKLAQNLRADAERLKQDLAKAAQAPPVKVDYGKEGTDAAWRKAVETERQRADDAQRRLLQLEKELDQLRQRPTGSPVVQSAPQVEPAETWQTFACALNRITVFEDGSAGSTRWEFIIRVQNEGGAPITARVNQELSDDKPTRVVKLNRVWPVRLAASSQGVRVDIEGIAPGNPDVKATGWGIVLKKGGPGDAIKVVAPKASNGYFEFEFSLVPRQK
ncbi:MAG: ATP-binding protein [Bryobacteraceae bacterium]|nr:ATP-binding protein [Bryobacteraceae bacterium]